MMIEQKQDILIKNGHVICMDPSGSRYQNADIAVKGGVITAICPQLSRAA